MKTTKLILALLFAFATVAAVAQEPPRFEYEYTYKYDANGNRVLRTLSLLTMRKADSTKTEITVSTHKVTVFPNPTRGFLKLNVSNLPDNTPFRITIADLGGRELLATESKQSDTEIDLRELPNGAYFMLVAIGDKSELIKIIKEE